LGVRAPGAGPRPGGAGRRRRRGPPGQPAGPHALAAPAGDRARRGARARPGGEPAVGRRDAGGAARGARPARRGRGAGADRRARPRAGGRARPAGRGRGRDRAGGAGARAAARAPVHARPPPRGPRVFLLVPMIHALFMDGGSRRRARSLMCTGGRARIPARALLALAALPACVGLGPDDAASSSPGVAAPAALRKAPGDAQALADQYRSFLDRGRTPALYIRLAAASAPGFRRVDPLTDAPARLSPGDRLLFVDRDRSAIFAVIGRRPLADAGARLIGAHIDTPAPRLDTTQLTRDGQVTLTAYSYGGIKRHHWLHRPLAAVGQVAARGGRLIDVALGLPPDELALFATKVSQDGKTLEVMTSSTPTEDGPAGPAQTLVSELHRRHGIAAPDLVAAELFLVPREPAREVGLDRALIGGHGQDDRSNSFVAWRAAADLPSPPDRTALVWLVDREEQGSPGPTGAGSHLLELVYAWLLRAEGAPASEA